MSSNVIVFPIAPREPHVALSYDGAAGAYVVEMMHRRSNMLEPTDFAFEQHQHAEAIEYALDMAERFDVAVVSSVGALS